jgi:hypothetical protein
MRANLPNATCNNTPCLLKFKAAEADQPGGFFVGGGEFVGLMTGWRPLVGKLEIPRVYASLGA